MKEFKVKITKGTTCYLVRVTHKETGIWEFDACNYFPKYTAKRLKRELIQQIENKKYKKEYEL